MATKKINEPNVKPTENLGFDSDQSEIQDAVIITFEKVDGKPSILEDYFLTNDQMITEAKNLMIIDSMGTPEHLDQLIESYSGLAIKGIEDMATYKIVDKAIKEVKKIGTNLSKRRTELTAPALKFQKDLIAFENTFLPKIKDLVTKLSAEKTRIDDAKEAAKRKLYTDRVEILVGIGYQLTNNFFTLGAFQIPSTDIANFNEQEFQFWIDEGNKEIQRREAENKRKQELEAELTRQRDELAQERLAIQTERLAIQKEREESRKMLEELKAQKIALEQTYEQIPPEDVPPVYIGGVDIMENAPLTTEPVPVTTEPVPVINQTVPVTKEPVPTQPLMSTSEKIAQQNAMPPVDEIPLQITQDFINGFDACRVACINIMKTRSDINKKSGFIEAFNNLDPKN